MNDQTIFQSLQRRFPHALSSYQVAMQRISQSVFATARSVWPCRVAFYPTFRTANEFSDACFKALYFLPRPYVNKITMTLDHTSGLDVSDPQIIPRPEYFGNEVPIVGSHLVIRDSRNQPQCIMDLLEADFIFVWDWRKVRFNPFFHIQISKLRNVDRYTNTWDGWSWAPFIFSILPPSVKAGMREEARSAFHSYAARLPRFSKCYVFGTGPSLESAFDYDFSDGYRIVCNTIVKNQKLLEHIKPHFIVAADAIYHFGNTVHACQFRQDLAIALNWLDTRFLVPEIFYPLLSSYHPEILKKTIPVRTDEQGISLDLDSHPTYANLHNILNGLLLPLASALAQQIYLLGFDGRAPTDDLFWKNSETNSYGDLKQTISAAHPGFFKGIDYEEYARWQSDNADRIMTLGESMGKTYTCLNRTFIPALQIRQFKDRN